MTDKNDRILRTKFVERLCHWTLVACFMFTALSGLSWFFPSLSWLNSVLGTPQMARILHPFLGIAVFLALCFMFIRFAHHNTFRKTDLAWFKNIGNVLMMRKGPRLYIGKYNAGQKVLFWLIMAAICVLLVSGLMMWRAYFAEYFPIWALRLAILAHSIAGIGLILLILGHIYMGLWVRGSISGMATGYVSRKWAHHHHDRWYDEIKAAEEAPKA